MGLAAPSHFLALPRERRSSYLADLVFEFLDRILELLDLLLLAVIDLLVLDDALLVDGKVQLELLVLVEQLVAVLLQLRDELLVVVERLLELNVLLELLVLLVLHG